MKNLHRISAALVMSGAIAGCTSLEAPSFDNATVKVGNDTKNVASGWVYYLPQRSFNMTLGTTLTQCEVKDGKLFLAHKSTAAVTAQIVADHKSSYAINPETLSKGTKITSLSVEMYDNGTLKSVNASAEDRTAEIAGNLVKTGISIAAIASGVPVGAAGLMGHTPGLAPGLAPANDEDVTAQLCRGTALEALKTVSGLKPQIEAAQKEDKAKKPLRDFATAEVTLQKGIRGLLAKALEAGDAEKVKNLRAALTAQDAAVKAAKAAGGQSKTAGLVAQRTKAEAAITATMVVDWVPNSGGPVVRPATLPEFTDHPYKLWLTDLGACFLATMEYGYNGTCVGDMQNVWAKFPALGMDVRLYATAGGDLALTGAEDLKNPADDGGLIYRQPRTAKLEICNRACGNTGDKPLHAGLYTVPQFGRIGRLELESDAFDDVTLAATFGADGTLLTATHTSTAQLEAASKLLLDSTQAIGGLVEARRARGQTKLQSEIDGLKLQTQRYEELKNLEDARRAFEASQSGDVAE